MASATGNAGAAPPVPMSPGLRALLAAANSVSPRPIGSPQLGAAAAAPSAFNTRENWPRFTAEALKANPANLYVSDALHCALDCACDCPPPGNCLSGVNPSMLERQRRIVHNAALRGNDNKTARVGASPQGQYIPTLDPRL